MIKVKIKNGKTKVTVKGAELMAELEIAFVAAACIKELAYGKAEFERIKQDVMDQIAMITLTEDGKDFDFGFDTE